MTNSFAEVLLPVPVDHPFTYSVPNEFSALIRKGSRVLVPFGRKFLTGIVIRFSGSSDVAGIKPVRDILDAEPAVPDDLLELSGWISRYYIAPQGEVVRAFFPQGYTFASKRTVTKIPWENDNVFTELPLFSPSQKKILRYLNDHTSAPVSIIEKATGIKRIHSVLSELEKLGFVSIKEELQQTSAGVKNEKFVIFKSIPRDFLPRGVKQRIVLEKIKSLAADAVPLRDLMKATRSSVQTILSLSALGIISIEEREAERKTDLMRELTEAPRALLLTDDQKSALEQISSSLSKGEKSTYLLHGVTGSGKTQVYIEALRLARSLGKTAIVLVPEISLTPQTVRRFRSHFTDDVVVMHSRMSPGERYDAWRNTSRGKYSIVIGPRSAIFAPLRNIGLIIVDEEHESTYKQYDQLPRYHARDVAIVRASFTNAVTVLGSATPSIESYFNAKKGKYRTLSLPNRIDDSVLPEVIIVDMKLEQKRRFTEMKKAAKVFGKKAFEGGFHSISDILEKKINDRLTKREGIILLQNRRGYAPFMLCEDCGGVERCTHCDVTMTYHLPKKNLRCHYCGMTKPILTHCSACKSDRIKMQGFGTQRVEEDLRTLFPGAKIARMDLDTTSRKDSHDRILQKFGARETDILLGTQMVAKGLDFAHVTLVGVISADTQMLLPDFRSAERTFQLLTQVAGRAGRSSLRGEVVIQTYQTGHYALKHATTHDFTGFFEEEIRYRREALYPPFTRLVLIEFKGRDENKTESAAAQWKKIFLGKKTLAELLGPNPAMISKISNLYRFHIVLKSNMQSDPNGTGLRQDVAEATAAVRLMPDTKNVRINIDVDPHSIM